MKSTMIGLAILVTAFSIGCNRSQEERDVTLGSRTAVAGTNVKSTRSDLDQLDSTRDASDSLEIFEKRILPIFQSPQPSSCAECHLGGVDLKQYIRPTQEQTFSSLVSAGLIDTETPEDSKILRFILRKPDQPDLITDKVREQEHAAFLAWIQAAVSNQDLLLTTSDEPIGPQVPDAVVRHARRDRVMASFIDNVWTEVGRCAACHSPDRNSEQVEEYGEQVSWITLREPLKTLEYMVDSGLIDPDEPENSLLLMKPTLQVDHGGGQKMIVGDRTYKQFRRFIDDYAAVVQGKYTSTEQLPHPTDEVSLVTEIWLKVEGVPAEWDKLLMQVDLYRQTDRGWSNHRVATSDRAIFGPNNLWQHSLSLVAPRNSEWADSIDKGQLQPGRYLAKIYVDRQGKLANDFTSELDQEDLVGEVEFESNWRSGYGNMTVIQFAD